MSGEITGCAIPVERDELFQTVIDDAGADREFVPGDLVIVKIGTPDRIVYLPARIDGFSPGMVSVHVGDHQLLASPSQVARRIVLTEAKSGGGESALSE